MEKLVYKKAAKFLSSHGSQGGGRRSREEDKEVFSPTAATEVCMCAWGERAACVISFA